MAEIQSMGYQEVMAI